MEQGVIDVESLAGGIDLQATVESGQSYLWDREDGEMYQRDGATGGDAWYWTTIRHDGSPAVIRVRQRDAVLEWESTVDAERELRRLLRLDDDLPAIRTTAPDDDVVQSAYETFWGMRLVQDPPFGSLISFICSAQMRVSRIHSMQQALRDAFGETVEFDGRTYNAYPTPTALADTTEERLRDLGLGYRAPYVQRTAEMVANGEADPEAAVGLDYEDARESLTRFVGVGDKVADCVLLFSLDYLEAVPLDTWIRTTIEEYYPECERGNYADTSRAIRAALGGEYAGYTQTYLFHYLRTGSDET
ncbi:DNA-3-methyladenine glycosylase 2 family protein [Haloarcula sp. CBA1130]|uniref:DNA-3-methyladenine glycosylase family protein n=1 Tax=unclassified Haloarcula TaxID=2624677 RepID=UPI001245F779|nr:MULTISPECIES: DNA glycosylase [unclassified Haloarcula]KAA9397942.1 DNA-3-methyladenine glycosylase 2 family protein [Haloarcula sp. CBA1129]KAA9402369.1 DNA-3-methyladenine glycosylase 2 family protein [Haloarcula sp. CBA1130]